MNLKILILSTSNPYKAAGIAAYDVFKGFKKTGFLVKLVVKQYIESKDRNIICINSKLTDRINTVKRKMGRLFINKFHLKRTSNPDYIFQGYNLRKKQINTRKILKQINFKPDAIILFFTQEFINAKNIFELRQYTNATIIWQLVDMSSFTGGCHYSWKCERYKTSCGYCPALNSNKLNDLTFKNLKYKFHYFSKIPFTLSVGSDWLIKRVENSFLFKDKPLVKVYLSVDSSNFYSVKSDYKSKLRKKLQIPVKAFVLLVAASSLNQKRKGLHYIIKTLNLLEQDITLRNKIFILVAGKGGDKLTYSIKKLQSLNIGQVTREELPALYQMSDLFVSAALQDVGPYMVIESLMCGTPVVAFNTGFVNDFIINNETGFLVDSEDTEGLYNGIANIIKLPKSKMEKMRATAAQRTKQLLCSKDQIESYINIIKKDKVIL